MPHLIKYRQVQTDGWQLLDREVERLLRTGEDGLLPDFADQANLIVPLALWRIRREDLLDRRGGTGLWLNSDEDPASIVQDLSRLQVMAIRFPTFADGRGYSTARLLRERYGYRGELRAFGDVLRDQLYYLSRCGFDAFALRDDQDPQQALSAFDDFSDNYQATVERLPLFRRRLDPPRPREEKERAA
jgi:uncharacterized protein (DUF934 family)